MIQNLHATDFWTTAVEDKDYLGLECAEKHDGLQAQDFKRCNFNSRIVPQTIAAGSNLHFMDFSPDGYVGDARAPLVEDVIAIETNLLHLDHLVQLLLDQVFHGILDPMLKKEAASDVKRRD